MIESNRRKLFLFIYFLRIMEIEGWMGGNIIYRTHNKVC